VTDEETTDDDTTEEHDSYSGRSLFSHLPTEKNVLLPYQERRRSFEPNIISDSSNDDNEEEQERELMADKDEGFESVRVSVARIRLAFKRLVGWRDMTSFDKALFVVTSPIWLLFNITIPCVELEGYNRVFSSLCAIFSSLLLLLNRSNPIQSNQSRCRFNQREREREIGLVVLSREDHRADVGEELGSTASQSHQRGSCRSQTSKTQHQRHTMVEK